MMCANENNYSSHSPPANHFAWLTEDTLCRPASAPLLFGAGRAPAWGLNSVGSSACFSCSIPYRLDRCRKDELAFAYPCWYLALNLRLRDLVLPARVVGRL